MTDQELVAKTVFGEITLGEVFSLFEHRISSIGIGPVERTYESDYDSWWMEEGFLVCIGKDEVYERRIQFELAGKVKVYEQHLEAVSGNRSYRIVFNETKSVKFDQLLPGGKT